MKKRTILALAVIAAGIATIAYAPSAASATEKHDGKYVLAVWRNDAGAPKFPQYLITSYVTNSTNVKVLQDYVADHCGSFLQSDLYANDARTASLIAGGILNGGMESWPLDSKGNQIQRYDTFTTQPCPVATTPPVVTPEPTPVVTPPISETPEPTEEPSSPTTPAPTTPPSPTTTASPEPSTPTGPIPVITPTPSDTTSPRNPTPTPTVAPDTPSPEPPVVTPQPTGSSDSGPTSAPTSPGYPPVASSPSVSPTATPPVSTARNLAYTGDERPGILFGAGLLLIVIGGIVLVTKNIKRKGH